MNACNEDYRPDVIDWFDTALLRGNVSVNLWFPGYLKARKILVEEDTLKLHILKIKDVIINSIYEYKNELFEFYHRGAGDEGLRHLKK